MPSTKKNSSHSSAIDLTRRRILQSVPALCFAPALLAQNSAQAIAVQKLHSFGLRVSNLQRSLEFYQDLFGAPIQAQQENKVCLRIGNGPHFFSMSQAVAGEQPSISHVGLSVANFDVNSVARQLAARGIQAIAEPGVNYDRLSVAMRHWITTGGSNARGSNARGSNEESRDLYFADVEGIVYHLSAEDYCGGEGELGNRCSTPEPAPTAGMFDLVDISHFTNFTANRDRANNFITDIFNKQYQAFQGPGSPVIGVGDDIQFLMYVGGSQAGTPTNPGTINHVCFSVEDFAVDPILARLTEYGLTAREDPADTREMQHWISMRMPNRGGAEGGTPELYFSDPDGLRIQLQDPGYCGGTGYLGDGCPDNL